ncbi:MAG TPA: trehalose-phosphatase [Steroidobacteraceae bacterium]|nr:trehalose-phosphatase [Steroidobacteraceae bacterium]
MKPAPPLAADNCLFLDLDGTLLDLRADPAAIHVDARLQQLLSHCATRLDGALAIISGRPIADLDASFAPLRFAAAGIHGLEWRGTDGVTVAPPAPAGELRAMVAPLAAAVQAMPMAQLEDKGASLALHWRRAPRHAPALRRLAESTLQQLGPQFRLLEGNCVIELLPRGANKGEAVREFLRRPPFVGRRPVYVGDDLTDVPGFAAARAAGGYGIAVGTRVAAEYRLPDVDAVRAWLGDGHE